MAAEAVKIYLATGRRKNAVARVSIRDGQGQVIVNGRTLQDYFPRMILRTDILKPLVVVERATKYNIKANIYGGGLSGQAGALRLGLARALVKSDEELRSKLRKAGLLTRDPRVVERKKYGQPGARKRYQYSKR